MLKKILFTLGLLSLTASTYAAHVDDQIVILAPRDLPVGIPQHDVSWTLGLEGLYYHGGGADYNVATQQTFEANVPEALVNNFGFRSNRVEPEYDWGWHADLTYKFGGNGRFAELGYTRLHGSHDKKITRGNEDSEFLAGTGILPPTAIPGLNTNVPIEQILPDVTGTDFPDGWDTAKGRTNDDYYHIDLLVAQRFRFGQKVKLAAYGGLRLAHMDLDDQAVYIADTQNPAAPVQNRAAALADYDSSIYMIGPRTGMDTRVHLMKSLFFVGGAGGSVLMGDFRSRSSISVNSTLNNVAVGNRNVDLFVKTDENIHLVPELDARFGLQVRHAYTPDVILSGEVGYDMVAYFDVKDSSILSFVDSANHDNDYTYRGFYFRAQIEII